jgi:hypothetical protein
MRRFNSKKIAAADQWPEYSSLGFQVMDQADLDSLADDEEGGISSKHHHYSPLPVQNPAPGAEVHKPSEWAEKVKEIAKNPSPVGKGSDYIRQNLVNKRIFAGAMAAIDHLYRKSGYKCKECNGKKHTYDPNKSIEEHKICPNCWGKGHTMHNPESSIMDISKSAEDYNKMISFHETHCGVTQCSPHCAFKQVIDDHIRRPSKASIKDLRKSDTHLRPNSKNPLLHAYFTPRKVVDHYKPIASILQILGGHEDDPLHKYDVCFNLGHDTNNPDASINKDDQGFHRFKETYQTPVPGAVPLSKRENCPTCEGKGCMECNNTGKVPDVDTTSGETSWAKTWVDDEGKERQNTAVPMGICETCGKAKNDINHTARQFPVHNEAVYGEGPRDKRGYSIIVNANKEGTMADVITFYRPIEQQRKERAERLDNGGHPERGISLDTKHMFNNDPSIYDDDEEGRKLKEHTSNIMADVSHFIGERSPVESMRATYEKNIPTSQLVRASNVTTPMFATAGEFQERIPRSEIRGTMPGAKPLTEQSAEQKVRANILTRNSTGFDAEKLGHAEHYTNNMEALKVIEGFTRDMHADYKKLHENNPKLPQPDDVTLARPISGRETTPYIKDTKAPTLPKREKKFNENVLGDIKAPRVEVPDRANFDLSTDDHKSDAINVLESDIGRKLNSDERTKAIEGIRQHNHIDGAYKALGMKTPDEQEEEENQ